MTRYGLKKLSLALLAGAVACGGDAAANAAEGDPETGDALAEGSARVINVETLEVRAGPFEEVIRLTGVAEANQDVTLSAEESGVIRAIVREKGATVEVGDWLFKIDDTVLQSQVAEARAQAEMARQTWERRKRLYEEDQVGSELAYLEVRYASEQATARLQTLEERLARTVIRAPIGGVLDQRYVEVGTRVDPGTQVARIVELNPVKIVAGVPERYAADVTAGDDATVHFPVLGESFTGTVRYVGATVNARNRTFPIELIMENPGRVIKPEMVANLELVRARWADVIVVPQEALIRTESGFKVFVVEGETVAERPVEVGASQQNQVMIESGLSPGEVLVVVGQQQVEAGDRVNVVGTR